jgi:outer membrane protein TolC
MIALSSILALALIGADDVQSQSHEPKKSPFTIQITIGSSDAQPQDCPKVGAVNTLKSSPSPSLLSLPKLAKPTLAGDPEPREAWPMTLKEAIRIGLDNSEIVRVIAFGAQGTPIGGFEPTPLNIDATPPVLPAGREPIVIARLNADAGVWRFQAEVMAHLRSIEQQYWNLAQAHVQLWSSDRAVSMAEEILKREEAELKSGRGTAADVAEVTQRLEQFKLDLITRTSDVITTERQLRFILGLPPADNRRIIPVTPPVEARLEPDWDSSLAQMLECQPDIAQQQDLVRLAELSLLVARNQLLPPLTLDTLYRLKGLGSQMDSTEAASNGYMLKELVRIFTSMEKSAALDADSVAHARFLTWQVGYALPAPEVSFRPPVNTRQAKYSLLRSRAALRQVVHQTTHSLARFFLEIDANYKQFHTASRLRAAAAQRLDAQRAYYEEGRITIDRFLDAVSQYATAVATEAQYKTTYNVAIVALEEAKGTLLAYDNIVVTEPVRHPASGQSAPPIPGLQIDTVTSPPTPTPTSFLPKPDSQTKLGCTITTNSGQATALPPKSDSQTKAVSAQLPMNPFEFPNLPALPPASVPEHSIPQGPTSSATKPKDAEADVKAKPKTWTFSISIGGAQPLVIKGTISADEPAQVAAPAN